MSRKPARKTVRRAAPKRAPRKALSKPAAKRARKPARAKPAAREPRVPRFNHDGVLKMWAEGEPVSRIAEMHGCSDGEVYRIARLARKNKDPRGDFPPEQLRDEKAAAALIPIVKKEYSKFDVETIAKRHRTEPRQVRAAIYLAGLANVTA